MDGDSLKKGFECLAGAYGPQNAVPLVGDLVGRRLLDMAAIAFSKLGSPSGILQNDGTMFPLGDELISLFKPYCRAIRSTEEGRIRCLASDCQGVMILAGGIHVSSALKSENRTKDFPIEAIKRFGFPRDGTSCYRCHAGLVELIRAISVDSTTGAPFPIGAIWAGQNRVKEWCIKGSEVRQMARDIGYSKPKRLVDLYYGIKLADRDMLIERAESLAETARAIEDSATASFHRRMQARFDKLTTAVLSHVRSSLRRVTTSSISTMQTQVELTVGRALKEVVTNIPQSCSALCEVGTETLKGSKRSVRVRATKSTQGTHESVDDVVTVNAEQSELDQLLSRTIGTKPMVVPSGDTKYPFLTRLRSAIGLDERWVTTVGSIPVREGGILWVQFLSEECEVVVEGNLLPDFLSMVENMLGGIVDMANTAYLTADQEQSVETLQDRTNELLHKDAENRRLFQAIAHQVAAPLMGLKQAAYILTEGFSRDAYHSFRACLKEYERGCWNFRIYDALTSEAGKDAFGFRKSTFFDIRQVVEEARKRVIPFADAKGTKIEVSVHVQGGYALRHVKANPGALVECLVNVIHNAIKYCLGSYPIEVNVSQESRSAVAIRVINHGIEIPQEDYEAVFDERMRCETAKAVQIDGSGIGLFICRNLLKMHDATIKTQSCSPAKHILNKKTVWKTTFLILVKC